MVTSFVTNEEEHSQVSLAHTETSGIPLDSTEQFELSPSKRAPPRSIANLRRAIRVFGVFDAVRTNQSCEDIFESHLEH